MPDPSPPRMFGEQGSPFCAQGDHACDSVRPCVLCEGQVYCDDHTRQCDECKRLFCEKHANLERIDGQWLCEGCASRTSFTEHEADHVETHGLDCGPYERWHEEWITCDACGDETDWKEVAAMAPKEAA